MSGRMSEDVTIHSDSDWACCKETRKSSTAGVILIGNHRLTAYTRKQNIIARRSSEKELYAAALGASESQGRVSLLCDLGYMMKPVLATDAQATEQILHRQGLGRLKHIDVAYLWVQDEVRSERLTVRRSRYQAAGCTTRAVNRCAGYSSSAQILWWWYLGAATVGMLKPTVLDCKCSLSGSTVSEARVQHRRILGDILSCISFSLEVFRDS